MKLKRGLNCKMSVNGLETSGVNSCTVSTSLLVSKLLKREEKKRWEGAGSDHLGKAIFHEHCYPNAQQETY